MNTKNRLDAAPVVSPSFTAPALLHVLTDHFGISPGTTLKVAFSGGLDSHVLLHALCQLRDVTRWQVSAVHVDHNLQAVSTAWAQHCQQVCVALDVSCMVESVTVNNIIENGLEAAERRARYACLTRHIGAGEVLLSAHHLDDQAETLLLQLMRGSGVHGLASMPAMVKFSKGHLARPLLGFTRRALAAYAALHRLQWVEDASNSDTRMARNFLRQRIFPLLQERWPGAAAQLGRSARHAADAVEMLDEIAQADVRQCQSTGKSTLSISALLLLSLPRQRNLIRYWLRTLGFQAPSTLWLDRILEQAHVEPRTRHAAVRWPGVEVRRYRDQLTVLPVRVTPDSHLRISWNPPEPLIIAGTGLALHAEPVSGSGLSQQRIRQAPLTIRLRQGGERCLLPRRGHHHSLKKLLQEAGVPPWERERLPLIYVGEELAAVSDRWVCEPYAAHADEPGWRLVVE